MSPAIREFLISSTSFHSLLNLIQSDVLKPRISIEWTILPYLISFILFKIDNLLLQMVWWTRHQMEPGRVHCLRLNLSTLGWKAILHIQWFYLRSQPHVLSKHNSSNTGIQPVWNILWVFQQVLCSEDPILYLCLSSI